jgi:hypothetical protein
MIHRISVIAFLAVCLCFGRYSTTDNRPLAAAECRASELTPSDAEILIYLLPQSAAVRGKGKVVGWELQTNPRLNQKDFYNFYLYDLAAQADGSPTVGYFSVNKHTAEIWDADNAAPVDSRDLREIQKILRKGHCIGDQIVKEFSDRRPGR